jgi:site-specific recombinase XerC
VGSPGRIVQHQPLRRQSWAGRTPQQILEQYRPGKAPPLKVLDVLLALFNSLHTSLEKTVSHKTRHERSQFLRRFFRDLHDKAGFKKLPDPRNLGQKHLRAMDQVWQREHLAPATIQTYLSFLRGLASWMGKHGFVRKPERYGLSLEEYERHEYAQRDKSWRGNGVDVGAALAQVARFDPRIAASMRLMDALGLRRKESVMHKPYAHVFPFDQTGRANEQRRADEYVWVKGKGGRERWIALETAAQREAVAHARTVVEGRDAHMGNPAHGLKRNLRRLDYALEKFGFTKAQRGVTAHGLRHGNLQGFYEDLTGVAAPVCSGGTVPADLDRQARLAVSERAGHSRLRAAGAYLGQSTVMRSKGRKAP